MFTNKYKKIFFVIKAKLNENLAEVYVIKANFQLETALKGKPTKVNELRDWNLLVEVKDKEQSLHIRNIQKPDQVAVSVTKHETLDKIKGTIRCKNQTRYKTRKFLIP